MYRKYIKIHKFKNTIIYCLIMWFTIWYLNLIMYLKLHPLGVIPWPQLLMLYCKFGCDPRLHTRTQQFNVYMSLPTNKTLRKHWEFKSRWGTHGRITIKSVTVTLRLAVEKKANGNMALVKGTSIGNIIIYRNISREGHQGNDFLPC